MYLEATLRKSSLARSLAKASADSSEMSRPSPLASRTILGRRVMFYSNGEHGFMDKSSLTSEEQYNSELMRFVHASLVAGEPMGDKAILWVDASKDPVDVYICGLRADRYLAEVHTAINIGAIPREMICDHDTGTVPAIKDLSWQA